jgi:DNA-directed RNA polymerase subunit beta'
MAASVKKGVTLVQWDPYNVPIITEKAGRRIEFRDMIPGVTIRQEVDESTGVRGNAGCIEHKERLHPPVIIVDEAEISSPAARFLPERTSRSKRAPKSLPDSVWPEHPVRSAKPRTSPVVFRVWPSSLEARRPKDACDIAEKFDGVVEIGGTVRAKRRLIVKDTETGAEEEHLIPLNKHIIVFKGDLVKKGQRLTEGPVVPHEILDICGPQELQEHLLNEVQEVYRLQGVEINDKHIEIIVRQMLRKVKITEQGDTSLLWATKLIASPLKQKMKLLLQKVANPPKRVRFCLVSPRPHLKQTALSPLPPSKTPHAS